MALGIILAPITARRSAFRKAPTFEKGEALLKQHFIQNPETTMKTTAVP
jgi:hypothetical protein